MNQPYPVSFAVDYPARPLDRMSTLLRFFYAIPIFIILATLSHSEWQGASSAHGFHASASSLEFGGLLTLAPALMIIFRQKYPRWWFDWNVQLLAFSSRVFAYFSLMSDQYPSTDEEQYVHLNVVYPDAAADLNRFLPIVKWLLATPHYIVLIFLNLGAFFAVIFSWFAILFTGTYPRGIFDYVEGVMRWNNRVVGYAFMLVTDQYPPFSLST